MTAHARVSVHTSNAVSEIAKVVSVVKATTEAAKAATTSLSKYEGGAARAAGKTSALGSSARPATASVTRLSAETKKLAAVVEKTAPSIARTVTATKNYARETKTATDEVKKLNQAMKTLENRKPPRGFSGGGGNIAPRQRFNLNTWFGDTNRRLNDRFGNLPILGQLASATGLAEAGLGVAMGGVAMAAAGVVTSVVAMGTGLALAVSEASQLDTAMSRVRAASLASRQEMAQLTEQASTLGARTQFSAAEVGRVQENYAKAGFSVREMIAAVPAALALSGATDTDTGFSSGLLSQVIRSIGFEASDSGMISDNLVTAANVSNVDVGDLAETMKYAAPVFANMDRANAGTAFRDLSALSGILGDQGIRGSMAGTGLRTGYLALASPTGRARRSLQGLGVDAVDRETGNVRRMPEILADLRTALAGKSTGEQSQALRNIFGAEGAGTFAAILSASPARFDELVSAMENSSGAAERTSRIMQDNLGGDLEQLGGAFSGLGTTIGSAMLPGVRDSTQGITDFVGALNEALIASGIAETGFGGLGTSISTMTDGLLLFMERVAPRIASTLEMLGVLEEGDAAKFAREMAGALTDARIQQATNAANRETDQITNEAISERRNIDAITGRVRSARGGTGQALASDIQRQLEALGQGDLLTSNPAVAAEMAQLRERGGLSARDQSGIRGRIADLLAPDADRLAQESDARRAERTASVDSARGQAQRTIESTRSTSQTQAVAAAGSGDNRGLMERYAAVMLGPIMAAQLDPFIPDDEQGRGFRERNFGGATGMRYRRGGEETPAGEQAGREQIRAVNALERHLQEIARNTRPGVSGGTGSTTPQ